MMEKHDKELQIQQVMKCINVSICQYPFNLYFVVCFPSGVLDYAVETLQLKRRNPMLKALKTASVISNGLTIWIQGIVPD